MILEFPLAERELARAGRSRRTYGLRFTAAGAMAILVGFTWAIGNSGSPEGYGQFLAGLALTVQYATALFVSPLLVASAITSEKEGRTLGLLLMADLGGRDIILSKFLSAYVQVQLLILSVLPVQAFAAFMGGIDIPAVAVQTLLLSVGAAAICAVGLFASTVCSRESTATSLIVLIVVTAYLSSLLVRLPFDSGTIPILNPFIMAGGISSGPLGSAAWAPSVIASIAVTCASLLAANLLLPSQAYDKPSKKRRPVPEYKRRQAIDSANGGAVAALVYSAGGGSVLGHRGLFVRSILTLGIAALAFVPCIGPLLVFSLVTRSAISLLRALHENGALEDLFLTPATDRELASQIMRAAFKRARAYLWAIVLGLAILFVPFVNDVGVLIAYFAALAVMLAPFWAALAFGCYGGTVQGSLRKQERAARLWWLLLLVLVFVLPIAGTLAVAYASGGIDSRLAGVFVMFAWYAWSIIVPIALGRFVFVAFRQRIRTAHIRGPKVTQFSRM